MPREWLIQHRAGTLAEWAAAEASGPVLLAGERAYITDLKLDVVGDGVTKVASLGGVGSGAYAPLSGARPGSLAVALGDSVTAGDNDNATQAVGESWFAYACALTGQKLQFGRNSGIGGNTTAQMLARFDTDVTPYAPTAVCLLAGTNDASTPFDTWASTYLKIIAKTRLIGAMPILGTIPPNNAGSPVDRRQVINRQNAFIRRTAALQGLPVIDFYTLLTDPTNGNYKSAYYNDGTHPNQAGRYAMGALAASVLDPILAPAAPVLCADDIDELNTVYLGTFAANTGTALPASWGDVAGNSGSAISYTTDAEVPGKLLTFTQTAAALRKVQRSVRLGQTTLTSAVSAGGSSLVTPVRMDSTPTLFIGTPGAANYEVAKVISSSGAGPQTSTLLRGLKYGHAAGEQIVFNALPGDTVFQSGIVTTNGGVAITAGTACTGAAYSPAALRLWSRAFTRGVFYQRFTVPAASTECNLFLQMAAGTGVVSWGRLGFYNATRGGF